MAENEGDGIAKVLYNKKTEEILGVHIIGIHAADLIQECANAMAAGTTVREISMMVSLVFKIFVCTKSLYVRLSNNVVVLGAYPSYFE